MSEEVQHMEESQVFGPGPVLKAARLEKGLTVEQIAGLIHLKPSLIIALENDEYDPSISMTFIKGYLKLYARQVDVSEAQVLDGLDNLDTHKKEPAKLQSFSRRVAHQANDDKLMLVTYLILAIVVALVVVWWFQQGDNETASTLDTPTVQSEAQNNVKSEKPVDIQSDVENDTAVIATGDVNESGLRSTDMAQETTEFPRDEVNQSNEIQPEVSGSLEDSNSILTPDNASPQDGVAPAVTVNSESASAQLNPQVSASAQTEQTGELVDVVFTFNDDCWVSVIDATGETIAVGVKVAGRVMSISGVAPFEVILGAPSVVQIRYADEDLDMSFLAPNSTAKFTLPRS
ncbi:transcriptional regulator, XRE family [Paraglaciecola sp. T6c]|uniref:RodZ domain-containing protein n=1 Tax=Pseudoalteromonas atlantica (strain T6c / ATCC BAA-1087) TaxID=3042615 RepID=UPI00005C630E|nr:RodZ domain-containing protein [Paraglaciecola sp. T6c]ABG41633.1 transcriptional regulator, XRE family [Paraglaciecola sp. T6c]